MATSVIPYHNSKHMEGGVKSTSVSANSYAEYEVQFTEPFSSAPTVTVCLKGSLSNVANAFATVVFIYGTPETTSFKFRVYNNTGNTRAPDVSWIAIGE